MPEQELSDIDMSSFTDAAPVAPVINVSTLDWPELQTTASACTACELHQSRTQVVFGTGNQFADWMVIGAAPDADEDQQGTAFVGDSGKLLSNMLRALGLEREQVYISSTLKCRPEGDRNPPPEAFDLCEAYLRRQIELVSPKVILAVGDAAAQQLLKLKTPLSEQRGQIHQYQGTPLVVMYHPSDLLSKPGEKAKSWEDLRLAASVVSGNAKAKSA